MQPLAASHRPGRSHRRRLLLVPVTALVLAACGAATENGADDPAEPVVEVAEDAEGGGTTTAPVEVEQVPSSPRDVTVSGLVAAQTGFVPSDLPDPLVDLEEIRSGGPPPDGIPPIDDPVFARAGEVDFLTDREPVLAFELDGDARAYPVQIMTWHEIVNDTVGGVPVTVSYCPLCNSAIAYDRRVDGRVLDFGTSGMLWNSALVMYDRQTETLWSHFTGEGIVGELTGVQLDEFPLATVSWRAWREANPDGLVLTTDTGHDREYGRNPYPGYDDVEGVPFLFEGEVDGRFTAMTRIVGIETDDGATGIPLALLQEDGVVATGIGELPLTVWWAPGTTSALDTASIPEGDDIGATGVFVPDVDGDRLTFAASGDGTFTDAETGSTWNLFGEAVDGPLAGSSLEAVAHVDTFWFAWAAFLPDTAIVSSG